MRPACEQKEEIRLRMAELEKKLTESEEERLRLEKTCNVLMKAFREEERMHYKALNKKYEKFLEDCSMRRKRNEIIMRSLCRIEDRSRALFAKTERLKLLKDRYISQVKKNQFKGDEVSWQFWKNFPFAPRDVNIDVTNKSASWKTSFALRSSHESYVGTNEYVLSRNNRFTSGSFAADRFDKEIPLGSQRRQAESEWIPTETSFKYPVAVEMKREELVRDRSGCRREAAVDERPKEVTEVDGSGHPDSIEKLRKSLSAVDHPESEWPNPKSRPIPEKVIESNELEAVEAGSESFNEVVRINHDEVASGLKGDGYDEEPEGRGAGKEIEEEVTARESPPNTEKVLPLGLDGVDYENETYPESYYEQPVHHHNSLGIASDVILEEDETEQEVDEKEEEEEEKNGLEGSSEDEEEGPGAKLWGHPKALEGPSAPVEPDPVFASGADNEECATDCPRSEFVGVAEQVRGQGSDSERSSGTGRSEECSDEPRGSGSERAVVDTSEKHKASGKSKSNLIHLLDSDSESFQIEHGVVVSGNEDSDFDFSFNKN